jgi:hypothetical protein
VTGVQTCALPIYSGCFGRGRYSPTVNLDIFMETLTDQPVDIDL